MPDEPPAPQADHIVLTDGESSRDFSAEGGTWQIDFDATADWTAEQVIPIAVQWYHFTPRLGKAGAGSVTVTVLPNTTDETRSAEIRLSAGRAEQILSITQQAGHVELTTENECEPSWNGSIAIRTVKTGGSMPTGAATSLSPNGTVYATKTGC
ncbi:MAG: BACON domain-containing protein [Alistipes communis]